MKKLYSKPTMIMESFAISEHFATGGGGCDEPLQATSDACLGNLYIPGIGQLFLDETICQVIPEDGEYGVCYHISTAGNVLIYS